MSFYFADSKIYLFPELLKEYRDTLLKLELVLL